jgi:hypothetical protein
VHTVHALRESPLFPRPSLPSTFSVTVDDSTRVLEAGQRRPVLETHYDEGPGLQWVYVAEGWLCVNSTFVVRRPN